MPTNEIAETSEWNPGFRIGHSTCDEFSVATRVDSDLGFTPLDSEFELSSDSNPDADSSNRDSDIGALIRFEIEGTEIFYKLKSLIGIGGMGKVFEAVLVPMSSQPAGIKKNIAVKLAKRSRNKKKSQLRLKAEAEILEQLEHPNIVRFQAKGAFDSESQFIAMERVEGINIVDFAKRKKLSLRERMQLFIKACNAISHCHENGIIHRDIKPSNILVDKNTNEPILIDFGIAKHLDEFEKLIVAPEENIERAKTDGQLIGTIQYMSPEQASQRERVVDHRADVYSLGVLLFEMITGSPFISSEDLDENSLDSLVKKIVAERDLSSIRIQDAVNETSEAGLLVSLERILEKAISLDPDDRYANVLGFKRDIESSLNESGTSLHEPLVQLKRDPVNRNRNWQSGRYWQALSLGLLILLAFAFRFTTFGDCSSANNDQAESEIQFTIDHFVCDNGAPNPACPPFGENEFVQEHRIEQVELQRFQHAPLESRSFMIVERQLDKDACNPTRRHRRILIRPNNKLQWLTQVQPRYEYESARDCPKEVQKQTIVQVGNFVRTLENESLHEVSHLIPQIPSRTLYKCLMPIKPRSLDSMQNADF